MHMFLFNFDFFRQVLSSFLNGIKQMDSVKAIIFQWQLNYFVYCLVPLMISTEKYQQIHIHKEVQRLTSVLLKSSNFSFLHNTTSYCNGDCKKSFGLFKMHLRMLETQFEIVFNHFSILITCVNRQISVHLLRQIICFIYIKRVYKSRSSDNKLR